MSITFLQVRKVYRPEKSLKIMLFIGSTVNDECYSWNTHKMHKDRKSTTTKCMLNYFISKFFAIKTYICDFCYHLTIDIFRGREILLNDFPILLLYINEKTGKKRKTKYYWLKNTRKNAKFCSYCCPKKNGRNMLNCQCCSHLFPSTCGIISGKKTRYEQILLK